MSKTKNKFSPEPREAVRDQREVRPEAALWLAEFLRSGPATILLVSHARGFINTWRRSHPPPLGQKVDSALRRA